MKHWRVSIDIEAPESDAARLRLILPELLSQAGYTTTSGTRTIECWLADDLEKPFKTFQVVRPSPNGNPRSRYKSMGHGPDG